MYELVLAQSSEVELVMSFIDDAKRYLKNLGIDQWQDGYPDLQSIRKDIEQGTGYFLKRISDESSEIPDEYLGYLCVDFGSEPTYEIIDGKWTCDEPYAVVHRVALSDAARGKGLSYVIFHLTEKLVGENGISYMRIDTHEDNKAMRRALEKSGYSPCGTVRVRGDKRIAYDKFLN